MSYNGWKNKETWLVNLWLGHMFAMDQEDGLEITPEYIEEQVQMQIDNTFLGGPDGFIGDLLNCALGEIDYYEIASHYVKEDA
jgi:hypothetical protein